MNSSHTGLIFKGNTTKVLNDLWDAIKKNGQEYQSQKGKVKSLKAVTLIIDDPLNKAKNYPYWSKEEDNWYQDNFVRKETNPPPETLQLYTPGVYQLDTSGIYPYKYAWRSRYYDSGYGYLKAALTALKVKSSELRVQNKKQLTNLLLTTYQLIHPEILLAVLAWKGSKLLKHYLENPQILNQELEANRVDTLEAVIEELKNSPNSRRAIIPSFIYPQIDLAGGAGGIPVYQNYQLYINFSKSGKPESLTSFHLHRAFDAYGGLQLDINHDKEWGLLASKKIGLPLKQIVIYGNDVWAANSSSVPKDIAQKTNIRDWLFSSVNAYDPKTEDIEKRLDLEIYQKKMTHALNKLTS